MTQNQIAYWTLQETKRSNAVNEQERERTNRANEGIKSREATVKEGQLGVNAQRAKVQNINDSINTGVNILKALTGGASQISGIIKSGG